MPQVSIALLIVAVALLASAFLSGLPGKGPPPAPLVLLVASLVLFAMAAWFATPAPAVPGGW